MRREAEEVEDALTRVAAEVRLDESECPRLKGLLRSAAAAAEAADASAARAQAELQGCLEEAEDDGASSASQEAPQRVWRGAPRCRRPLLSTARRASG